ncbi:hypothetical protein GE061_004737 [Apolygus lucorum]|uniref:Uncharacterized protein n=1 Tax=Apolygus lucorum TaxID=248454 RepID=A0A8S9X1J5_APOLU|nr:hypothetical protein GE061_004737 [Apolygus lucorum]
MIHPKTGQSIVISDVITGYLSPARPVPMPDIAQPMRPRIALVGGPHAFDSSHLSRPVNEEEPVTDDCPILDSSEEFPIEDLDDPVPDLLSVLNQQLQHLPTEDVNYVTRILTRFVEVQQPRESPEPEDPVKESPPAEVLPEEESQKTAAVAHRQLRRLPKKDYQQLHSGRPSKHPKPETKERRGAVMSKDLRAMIKDVERRLDEEESRDRSPDAEPPVEPQLPPPRALPPRTRTRPKDLDKEWTVLETGAEMMYGTQPRENPRVDAAEIARAVAQQLQQPQVNIPTSADIAREVVALMNEQLPPTQDPQQWADRIAELIVQKQSPAYSPIHDSGAIARAILIELRQHVSWQLHDAEQDASAPATSHENLAASAPTTSHEHLAASAPSTSRESLPASVSSMPREELVATAPTTSRSELPQAEGTVYDSQSEEEDRPVAERRCIACGRTRDHNSRLWCEACRAFLRRAKKAAIDGRPITCKDPRHRQNPDNAACRGCRAKHLQTLEAATTQPTDGRCAAEDIGFQRGGECDRRVPPLRITVRTTPASSTKRPRARSAGSPPMTAPAAEELPPPPPVAPPAAPPLRAHARPRHSTPSRIEAPP